MWLMNSSYGAHKLHVNLFATLFTILLLFVKVFNLFWSEITAIVSNFYFCYWNLIAEFPLKMSSVRAVELQPCRQGARSPSVMHTFL